MKNKVDLTLLHRLVKELENSLAVADGMSEGVDKLELNVELNKATGLATGIMTEAAMLVGDIQALLRTSSQPSSDALSKILNSFKLPPGSN